ncbi:unnamed protein product [Echinostoma caproni]|uniref:SF3b1 domain-containing protein n=1 Tax=Echinostoma caproni TaxID=27848 RepID=A0A183AGD8_9TREM|nr:unnamed protein product [Echinostoma caproni]
MATDGGTFDFNSFMTLLITGELRRPTIADREDEYRSRRRLAMISPARVDPFADGDQTPDHRLSSYKDIMLNQQLNKEHRILQAEILEKSKTGQLSVVNNAAPPTKRRRWDQPSVDTTDESKSEVSANTPAATTPSKRWGDDSITPVRPGATPGGAVTPGSRSQWDETPGRPKDPSATPGQSVRQWAETPGHLSGAVTPGRDVSGSSLLGGTPSARRNRWDETPHTERYGADTPSHGAGWAETPRADRTPGVSGVESIQDTPSSMIYGPSATPSTAATAAAVAVKRRSRWDETPLKGGATPGATPSRVSTPVGFTPSGMSVGTPAGPGALAPGSVFTPSGTTPTGMRAMAMATPDFGSANVTLPGAKVPMTPEQLQVYAWQKEIDDRNRPLTDEELDEILPPGYKIMPPPTGYVPIRTPARRLVATPTPMVGTPMGFRIATPDVGTAAGLGMNATGGNAAALGDMQPKGANLPMMRPDDLQYFEKLLQDVDEESLPPEEAKERKIMTFLLKIKNGTPPMRKSALRQITDKAREFGAGPLFAQILPLLMSPTLEDQERHLLVKAAGLATMISTMRPDIDNMDEYVRNTTARAFAVVASALGIPSLLPFLKAVCKSKKSWQARHTGIKIVQQISILMGCAILPHLRSLVEIIEHGLVDDQQKVRTITALALAALAEAATPYGIESFDSVLEPLWRGIRTHRGKGLAAFLKAIGYLIPLMDAEYANYYTREVMLILIREFSSPDEEMKKIVLKVVKQCCATDGVEPDYIKAEILPPFFRSFWIQRMAIDRRNYRQLVDTTIEIANKVGAADIISRVVDDLKDDSEQYRKMVMETIEKVMSTLGSAEIDARLEEQLIDGILYAFQEQSTEDAVMLTGFGTIVQSFGKRVKPYLPQICGTILWRLNNKSAKVRQQAADLISRIAGVMKICQEEKLMGHLGVVLYEYLGEEYPEVLGSILGALKAIVNVIGMTKMTPPIKELLPRLTPILKNRHEKVEENCIDLVGRIADRGADYVSSREWMRICFELLELLKAHKKSIRRATVNTFGYIAKAIGPHDVLATLLNNLKVQERQNRVCTTVAIAIVAETCSPFTVLPGLMNEYRVPELNVQNGVLKSLAFMFEYIGEMSKDYIYAVTTLLEDALMDRDLVHRQTAMTAVGHMALGVYGFGCEDALLHLLNIVWPNVLESSPHVVQAFMFCVEGLRVALGPNKILQYTLQGLFHPARKVRDMMWKVYNTIYIGNQDGLVYGFPRISDSENNTYVRHELDYIL